jgi:hypothetical protein
LEAANATLPSPLVNISCSAGLGGNRRRLRCHLLNLLIVLSYRSPRSRLRCVGGGWWSRSRRRRRGGSSSSISSSPSIAEAHKAGCGAVEEAGVVEVGCVARPASSLSQLYFPKACAPVYLPIKPRRYSSAAPLPISLLLLAAPKLESREGERSSRSRGGDGGVFGIIDYFFLIFLIKVCKKLTLIEPKTQTI